MTNDINEMPFIKLADQVKSQCEHFLKPLKLDFFAYTKRFHNNTLTGVMTDKDFAKFFIENKLYNSDIHASFDEKSSLRYTLWSQTKHDSMAHKVYLSIAKHGYPSGITIIEKSDRYVEFFHFGSNGTNSNTENFLINNIDIFKLIIVYCKDKLLTPNIVNFLDQSRLQINPEESSITKSNTNHDWLKKLDIEQYHLGGPFGDIRFTRREMQCLVCVANGETAKQIGQRLNLSFRTVQAYLSNVKAKTASRDIHELQTRLMKSRSFRAILSCQNEYIT